MKEATQTQTDQSSELLRRIPLQYGTSAKALKATPLDAYWADTHWHNQNRSDLIQGTYTPGGGIGEQLAVQKHDSGDEVEAQEHGHAQHHVQVGLGLRRRVREGQPRPPLKLKVPGHRMHCRHQQLQSDEQNPLHRHGDAPVVRAVVDDKQL